MARELYTFETTHLGGKTINIRSGPTKSFPIIRKVDASTLSGVPAIVQAQRDAHRRGGSYVLRKKQYTENAHDDGTDYFKNKEQHILMNEYEEHNALVKRAQYATKTDKKGKKTKVAGAVSTKNKAYTPKPSPTHKQTQQAKKSKIPDTIELDDDISFRYSAGLDAKITAMLKKRTTLNDIPKNIRAYGAPYQFISSTDHRPWEEIGMGRRFLEFIMAEAPIVNFVPGLPSYLPDFDKENKEIIKQYSQARLSGAEGASEIINKITNEDGRYFGFVAAYADYISYVNLLCRTAAIYLGIGDKTVPGTNTKYRAYNWADYPELQLSRMSTNARQAAREGSKKSIWDFGDKSITRKGVEAIFGDYKFVKFYVDPKSSFTQSHSNETTQSKISGLFDVGEGFAKEIQFLGGDLGKGIGDLGGNIAGVLSPKNGGFGSDSTFRKLFGMAEHVLSGSNIIFPDMWSDSRSSQSYDFTVHLKVPYGDEHSYMLGLVVPLMHILGMATARQTTANSFGSPFMVKVFCPGRYSCEMGMIDSLRITKGGPNGDAWSKHGLPLEMEITFSVRDLYYNFMITKSSRPELFFNNQGLMEYLAITCGLDLTKPNIGTKFETMIATLKNDIYDIPSNLRLQFIDAIRGAYDGWIRGF